MINFIMNLSLSKRRGHIYNAIFIIINRYIKMMRYFLIIKKIDSIKLLNLFYNKVVLRFNKFNNIVINYKSVFTSAF